MNGFALLFGAFASGASLPSLVKWANRMAERRFLHSATFCVAGGR